MAPVQRRHIAKERFGTAFSTLKSQTYIDPPFRGVGSQVYVSGLPRLFYERPR